MPHDLGKRTASVELFKSGKSAGDIAKILNVNRMLVWRMLKCFKSTGEITNLPGQGRPRSARTAKLIKSTREKLRRNPTRSLRNLAKEGKYPLERCQPFSTLTSKHLHTSTKRSTCYLQVLSRNGSKEHKSSYLESLLARLPIWYSVTRRNSISNNMLTSKMIGFGLQLPMPSRGLLLEGKVLPR